MGLPQRVVVKIIQVQPGGGEVSSPTFGICLLNLAQTGRQTGLSSYSYHGSVVHTPSGCCWKMDVILKKFSKSFHCLKIFLYFDCTFILRACPVITQCQPHCHRGHTSVVVTLRPKQKWRPFSQIIKIPNWLALTPLEYMLPYNLKQILFCGLLYKKPRVVILLLAFSNSFPSWKLRHCDCELTLRPKQNGHPLQMEFPNSCLFVWKSLFFDYKFTIRPKQNGHHFTENTLHNHFLVWILVWFD